MYSLPGVGTKTVDGSEFIAEIRGYGGNGSDKAQYVYVRFLKNHDGNEELISLNRSQSLAKDEMTTYGNFKNSLIEKYGQPVKSWEASTATPSFVWTFNKDGTLRKPISEKEWYSCGVDALGNVTEGNWPPPPTTQNAEAIAKQVAACGDIYLRVQLNTAGPTAVTQNSLVTSYYTQFLGLSATLRNEQQALALIDAASKKANAAAIDAARKQKPSL